MFKVLVLSMGLASGPIASVGTQSESFYLGIEAYQKPLFTCFIPKKFSEALLSSNEAIPFAAPFIKTNTDWGFVSVKSFYREVFVEERKFSLEYGLGGMIGGIFHNCGRDIDYHWKLGIAPSGYIQLSIPVNEYIFGFRVSHSQVFPVNSPMTSFEIVAEI